MAGTKQPDERYFHHVKKAWEALPQIDPRESVLPAEVLESWKRCVACGLEKSQADRNAAAMLESFEKKTGRQDAAGGRHAFRIQAGEHEAIFTAVELRSGGRPNQSLSEKRIGTNAAALAFRLQRGVFVNGPEHYAEALHGKYTYAEPIFDTHRQMCGVCSVSSGDYQTTVRMSELVHILACIGNAIYWMEQDVRARGNAVASLLEKVPQGVVYIDRKNVIKYFNRRAMEIFGLKDTSQERVIFTRCIALIWNVVGEGRQSAIVDYQNNKKKVNITAIPLSDNRYEKLLLLEENRSFPAESPRKQAQWVFDDIQTVNARMIRAKKMAAVAAPYNVPVMLVGKSGSGKELFAQSIHNASSRRNGPFVALNASAIAPNLVESTLFGYERGAFTGASQDGKIGYFEAASGGTLFLDELDSVPFDVQTKLLRALSSRQIRRVGGTEDIPVDVRIISAGRVDVLALTEENAFRADLYYRLSPVKIHIPSLAERREDIPALTRSFLEKETSTLSLPCPTVSKEFMACLAAYDWPGNVRELHNVLRHALVFLDPERPTLEPELLPDYMLQELHSRQPVPESTDAEDESVLRLAGIVAVCESLRRNHGNAEQTGKRLGISTATVYNYMAKARRYGLM